MKFRKYSLPSTLECITFVAFRYTEAYEHNMYIFTLVYVGVNLGSFVRSQGFLNGGWYICKYLRGNTSGVKI